MGLFKKDDTKREAKAYFSGNLGETLGQIPAGYLVDLRLNPEREVLIIRSTGKKDGPEITLPYDRIVSFKVEDEVSLVKSGSGLGRAIAGGLLFGGVGAVVGVTSKKGRTNIDWYGTLTYRTKTGELAQITLKEFMANGKNKSILAMDFEAAVAGIVSRYGEKVTEL